MLPAAYVRLDLHAARHNLQQVRRYAPGRKIMAVIKANAYGHGMLRMAEALTDSDAFAVARVDEGVRLRQAGFSQPIIVLQGFVCADELQLSVQHELQAVIHSPHQIELLSANSDGGQSLSVWLKQDSGMNRLGFKNDDFIAAFEQLRHMKYKIRRHNNNWRYSHTPVATIRANAVCRIRPVLSLGTASSAIGCDPA
jgi:alanine racemase